MEIILSILLVFMIIGAIYALYAKDLLSALISCGIVGYGLVICFLLLKAPDLAIVQIVVESTGIFRTKESPKGGYADHIKAGAKKVVLTVPAKDISLPFRGISISIGPRKYFS